jgi:outer membrane lipoprotein SlyB
MPSKRRRSKLAKRYGRFSAKDVRLAADRLRHFIERNPEVAAAALGGTVAAISAGAGVGPGTAAIVGATTGVVGQTLTRWRA